MSQWETSDHVSTRSVLRHRPLRTTTGSSGKGTIVTSAASPAIQRASRPRTADVTDDTWRQDDTLVDEERETYPPVRMQPASRRTAVIPAQRVSAQRVPQRSRPGTGPITRDFITPRRHAHPLLYLGIGMLAMLVLWTLLSAALGWFTTTLDDIRYGRPRTVQTDAWVGHNEQTGVPSHFIAMNLNGHIEIIEISGGDAAHTRVYVGPQLYGKGNELVPVTLQFVDVNSDSKPDMVISFQGSRSIFINDQGAFRPIQPGERQQVEQFLQNMKH
jgi:hypothetical protein